MSKKKKALVSLLVAAALFVCYSGANAISIWSCASVDETRRADAAIVLGAAAYDTGPSPVFASRLDHAKDLFERDLVRYIIVTGGVGEANAISDAAIGARYLIENGVPEDVVIVEEGSTITEENLKNAAKIVDALDLSDVLVVSDPLHMKRAMLLAADAGLCAYSSPVKNTLYRGFSKKLGFLARETFFYVGYKWLRPFR